MKKFLTIGFLQLQAMELINNDQVLLLRSHERVLMLENSKNDKLKSF